MSALPLSLEALAALCALFAVAFVLARWINNYGIVDIVWSYSFALLAVAYAILERVCPSAGRG